MDVIMFHSIGNHNSSWHKNWLSVSLVHFEEFCKFLNNKKYEALGLSDWYRLQDNPDQKNNRQVILTFDDGYLDNWVYAYPLLKKYKLKGTIFVNPEFVDPSNKIRPTIENVWENRIRIEELQDLGYLNWQEIRALDSSGVMDIQSHSMSHNYYFYSDQIIDHYERQDEYHWLAWVMRPDRKPFWITENQTHFAPYGYPIFEFGRALGLRRFFPSDDFVIAYAAKVQQLIGEKRHIIKQQLERFTNEYKSERGVLGRYETDKEMEERYRYELFESKRILEKKLDKTVDYLCWPGGGYNKLSIKLSQAAGYKASTVASRESDSLIDNSLYYKRIQRFGMGSFFVTKGERRYEKDKNFLINRFKSQKGSYLAKVVRRFTKINHLIQYYLNKK